MNKKIFITIILLLTASLSFFLLADIFSSADSALYSGIQEKLNERLLTATAIFGVTKFVAGVISFFQSIQIEAGFAIAGISASPLEILAPINGTIDEMAELFLFAVGAIVLQKLLMLIAGWVSFKLIVPLAMLLLGIYIWTGRERLRNLSVAVLTLAIMSVVIVPASVGVSAVIERYLLSDMLTEATNNIEARELEINKLQKEIDGERSTWEMIKDKVAIISKIKGAVNDMMTYSKAIISDMLNAFIVMLLTTVVIPLLTLLGACFAFKSLLNWLKRLVL